MSVVVLPINPVTLPEPSTLPLVATVLLHVPPAVASVSAITEPTQTLVVPVMIAGEGFTVATAFTVPQTLAKFTVVVAIVLDKPKNIPEAEPIEPTAGTVLLQVPPVALPAGKTFNVTCAFWHMEKLPPEIEAGVVFTIAIVVPEAVQLVASSVTVRV